MKVLGIVGWKNSGKTRLVERLVAELTRRGVTVSTIKHAHHGFDVDQEGTDSHRHRTAGAREVLVSSSRRWALMHEVESAEAGLEELLSRLTPVDLVLVEGFKRGPHCKIEARRQDAASGPEIAPEDPTVIAVASDVTRSKQGPVEFQLDDIDAIAGFIEGLLADPGYPEWRR